MAPEERIVAGTGRPGPGRPERRKGIARVVRGQAVRYVTRYGPGGSEHPSGAWAVRPTKRLPWVVRSTNRRRNKAARLSRRRNR